MTTFLDIGAKQTPESRAEYIWGGNSKLHPYNTIGQEGKGNAKKREKKGAALEKGAHNKTQELKQMKALGYRNGYIRPAAFLQSREHGTKCKSRTNKREIAKGHFKNGQGHHYGS